MNILYFEWNSYANSYVKDALNNLGYTLTLFPLPTEKNMKSDEKVASEIINVLIRTKIDYCFSLNYFPIVAIAAMACNKKYISWTYDSPYVFLYSDTINLPINYAFIFDYAEYSILRDLRVKNVYHMPLASATKHFDKFSKNEKYICDISMVGSTYNESKHSLYTKFNSISDYSKGFLESLINAQAFLYGVNFIEEALTNNVLSEIKKCAPLLLPEDEMQDEKWVYSKYFIDREITRRERLSILTTLSQNNCLYLFTNEETPYLPKVKNLGKVDYFTEMPQVFKSSKINLNVSLRSIVSGIPLRCFDILGCGGFLLTNFQPELCDYFEPNTDFVYFESIDDLNEKVEYYLSHEKERIEISRNGYQKVKEKSTYENRLSTIISIAKNSCL